MGWCEENRSETDHKAVLEETMTVASEIRSAGVMDTKGTTHQRNVERIHQR